MKLSTLLVSSLLSGGALATAVNKAVSYDGYKVVRVAMGEDNFQEVQKIIKSMDLETWKNPKKPGSHADIVVPPSQISKFDQLVGGMDTLVMHKDLGASIAGEAVVSAYKAGSADPTWFNSYHSYADHMKYLDDLHAAYPNSEVVVAGKSHQGRDIKGLHFWGSGGKGKPAAIFHGTVHAREWISTMTVEYLAYTLTSKAGSDASIKALLDKFDFYIFPVANPDGFVHTQTSDRMWRKNRQPNQGGRCEGRDLNRNWPLHWNGPGSSDDPCSEQFRGYQPGDGTETKVHTAFIKSLPKAKLFIDFHAYGQMFMTPYGYDCNARPRNDALLQRLAQAFGTAVRGVYGTAYKTGPICRVIYQASGSSVDWAVDAAGVETAFAAELRDTGANGFILPASQIKPSGEETFAGIKALLQGLN
ncbi:hypothetical protein FQN57_005606 [Myotisia sp. PD_48]|nr:hypothetical protein FQN57_005606 [Myotisia sp. PD_48]